MARIAKPLYTDQDRSDFSTLNGAIDRALKAQAASTLAALDLGSHLKEVKDRSLWKLERPGGRSSFYDWVTSKYEIRKTMARKYLAIGGAFTKEELAGRRISVNCLALIARTDKALHPALLAVADHEETSEVVQVAIGAGKMALEMGTSIEEAITKALASPSPKKEPKESVSLFAQLKEALDRASGEVDSLSEEALDSVEGLAWELLSLVRDVRSKKPVPPKPSKTDTAVSVPPDSPKDKPKLYLIPLAAAVAVVANQPPREEDDQEYLLRLQRPQTTVPLALPPEVPAVPRALVDKLEPLLARVAGLCNNKKVIPQKQMEEAFSRAMDAAMLVQSEVGVDHPLMAIPLEWLSRLRTWAGDYEGAERDILQILRIWHLHDDKEQNQILEWRNCLGVLLTKMGRFKEAAGLLKSVLACRTQRLPKGHPLLKLSRDHYCQAEAMSQAS